MTREQLIEMAVEQGFSAAAVIGTESVPFDPAFRPLCEENLCGKYGVNYACPPDCGTPEEMQRKVTRHRHALVLQTLWQVDDFADTNATGPAKAEHNAMSLRLVRELRKNGCDGFLIGSGGCALCRPCAIVRGESCTFPDLRYSCMSAYCIFVRKLCEQCGIEYDAGAGLLALYGMYVFD